MQTHVCLATCIIKHGTNSKGLSKNLWLNNIHMYFKINFSNIKQNMKKNCYSYTGTTLTMLNQNCLFQGMYNMLNKKHNVQW